MGVGRSIRTRFSKIRRYLRNRVVVNLLLACGVMLGIALAVAQKRIDRREQCSSTSSTD